MSECWHIYYCPTCTWYVALNGLHAFFPFLKWTAKELPANIRNHVFCFFRPQLPPWSPSTSAGGALSEPQGFPPVGFPLSDTIVRRNKLGWMLSFSQSTHQTSHGFVALFTPQVCATYSCGFGTHLAWSSWAARGVGGGLVEVFRLVDPWQSELFRRFGSFKILENVGPLVRKHCVLLWAPKRSIKPTFKLSRPKGEDPLFEAPSHSAGEAGCSDLFRDPIRFSRSKRWKHWRWQTKKMHLSRSEMFPWFSRSLQNGFDDSPIMNYFMMVMLPLSHGPNRRRVSLESLSHLTALPQSLLGGRKKKPVTSWNQWAQSMRNLTGRNGHVWC